MENAFKAYPFRAVLSLRPLVDYLRRASREDARLGFYKDLETELSGAPELLEPIEEPEVLKRHEDLVHRLMSFAFPPAFWDTEAFGAVVPFSPRPFFTSPAFKTLFLDGDGGLKGRTNLADDDFTRGRAIRAFLFILEQVYGITQKFDYPVVRIVPDPETGLDRHYQMHMDFRFVEVLPLVPPRPLSDEDRAFVLENLGRPERLREILPPEKFELRGFTAVQAVDVTEREVITALERDLIDQESIMSQGGFLKVQQRLRTLFRRPDLTASLAAIRNDEVLLLNSGCEMTRSCIFADSRHVSKKEFEGTVYEEAVKGDEVARVPDILEKNTCGKLEEEILEMGVRCLLVAPLCHKGACIGTLDLGSPRPGDLGPMDALVLDQLRPMFSVAIQRALDDLNNQVQRIIKEKCTAIHPTVEWRFRKAALRHMEALNAGRGSEMEPIVFKDVYPLYASSDIRGSADERNRAIREDLVEHLGLVAGIVEAAYEAKPLLVFQELRSRVETHVSRIRAGLASGDEPVILRFVKEEIEPLFPHLRTLGLKVNRAVDRYEDAVDASVGTVYRLRKAFEESVGVLNGRLTSYLDREEAQAQAHFPHFFERHRTDGVDYLIYVGSSLLETGQFERLYLDNLRLWQIKVACGMAWHTERLRSSLKVPLDTTHLILVQNAPLSIGFRFDEKRFDVDGAYDIRNEIIKSRIDKAVIKGGRERLTQPGHLAVVFSSQEEGEEMQRHLAFFQEEGYLKRDLVTLDLEELPGVQGLKAYRVGIDLESGALGQIARFPEAATASA